MWLELLAPVGRLTKSKLTYTSPAMRREKIVPRGVLSLNPVLHQRFVGQSTMNFWKRCQVWLRGYYTYSRTVDELGGVPVK